MAYKTVKFELDKAVYKTWPGLVPILRQAFNALGANLNVYAEGDQPDDVFDALNLPQPFSENFRRAMRAQITEVVISANNEEVEGIAGDSAAAFMVSRLLKWSADIDNETAMGLDQSENDGPV